MFFDRNEIHIQAFQEIPAAKWMPGNSSSSTFHVFMKNTQNIIKHNSKNEKSRLLVMYSNPCGLGIWDLALIPHKMPDYYIIFLLEYKNKSHGGKSIFFVDK